MNASMWYIPVGIQENETHHDSDKYVSEIN